MRELTSGNREAWLSARTTGIGSSDAPVLVGAARKSLLELWSEKVGLAGISEDETELMEAGLELQPGIGRMFARRTKRLVLDIPPWTVYQSAVEPWALASPDFFCEAIPGHETPGGVEVKFVTFVHGDDWEDEPPLAAQVQVQHQMFVTEREWWSVAGLVRGRLKYADVDRDDAFIAELIRLGREFQRRVELRDPPPPDASESARRVLDALYPRETPGQVIALPVEAVEWDRQYVEGQAAEKAGKTKKDEAGNQLRALIGEAERGVLPGGRYWTLKTIEGKQVESYYRKSYRDLKPHHG